MSTLFNRLKVLISVVFVSLPLGLFASSANIKESIVNTVSQSFDNLLEEGFNKLLPNAEITVSDSAGDDPVVSILTVVPLQESKDLNETTFFQGSVYRQDSRQTLNLGLGYRQLSSDEKWLYGINGFFDQEFPYNHQRASLGFEVRSSAVELNANKYWAISNWESGKDSLQEHALGGHDLEFGAAIPYVPSSKIYHKEFKWSALDGLSDLKGSTTSLNLSGDILVPGLRLEVGRTNYNGTKSDKDFISLTYQVNVGKELYKPLISNKAFVLNSMKEHRLDKVRRENRIVKQNRSRGTISFR